MSQVVLKFRLSLYKYDSGTNQLNEVTLRCNEVDDDHLLLAILRCRRWRIITGTASTSTYNMICL